MPSVAGLTSEPVSLASYSDASHDDPESRRATMKDYRGLWQDVTGTRDEGKAVRTLARILVDKEGRNFISNLRRTDAELCIELLDHVSHRLYQIPPPAASDGFFRVSQCTSSKLRRNRLSSSR